MRNQEQNRFKDADAAEKTWSQDPRTISGYNVGKDGEEYVIELFCGANIYQTIPGYPRPHRTAAEAHAHATRLGYRPL